MVPALPLFDPVPSPRVREQSGMGSGELVAEFLWPGDRVWIGGRMLSVRRVEVQSVGPVMVDVSETPAASASERVSLLRGQIVRKAESNGRTHV